MTYGGLLWQGNCSITGRFGLRPLCARTLASIAADGIKRCTLERDTILDPATKTDRVSIICGQRGVLMLKGKIGGKGVADVEEFIRSEP